MAENDPQDVAPREVDLKDPLAAAFYALLLPGLGHLYQGRTAKGILFMICILGTYLYGWNLGGCRVVYASWRQGDKRWQYVCQMWAGGVTWPAAIQTGFDNPFGDFMRQPGLHGPDPSELNQWHRQYHSNFEMGTVFTMIAGLLNILVIFDAAGGPVGSTPAAREKENKKQRRDRSPPDQADPQNEEPVADTA